jgi:CRP/FNR family transcriptional regulator, cyclic AMP receptor protein
MLIQIQGLPTGRGPMADKARPRVFPSGNANFDMAETAAAPVHLLAEDPDLGRALDQRRAREASQRLLVRALEVPRGRWVPNISSNGASPIGLLVLDGLLVRESTVGHHPAAELLGPGDLLRAWDEPDAEILLPRTVDWSALTACRVAIIDHAFALRAAQWPEIFALLIERAGRRAERLQVMQAIAHLTRVDDRLLALMWCLAERWGRVVPEGVLVSLRLPHRTLAAMIGARRPSVTTALGQLMSRGELARRPDGGYVLKGDPPEAGDEPDGDAGALSLRSA